MLFTEKKKKKKKKIKDPSAPNPKSKILETENHKTSTQKQIFCVRSDSYISFLSHIDVISKERQRIPTFPFCLTVLQQ